MPRPRDTIARRRSQGGPLSPCIFPRFFGFCRPRTEQKPGTARDRRRTRGRDRSAQEAASPRFTLEKSTPGKPPPARRPTVASEKTRVPGVWRACYARPPHCPGTLCLFPRRLSGGARETKMLQTKVHSRAPTHAALRHQTRQTHKFAWTSLRFAGGCGARPLTVAPPNFPVFFPGRVSPAVVQNRNNLESGKNTKPFGVGGTN